MNSLDLQYYVEWQTIVKGSEMYVSTSIDAVILLVIVNLTDVYHSIFTRSDLYLGAEHVLEHTAHILASTRVCC